MRTPEGQAKFDICAYLDRRRDCIFWVQESQGTYDAKRGLYRKKRSRFQKNGIPDITVLLRPGSYPPVYVGLEVKAGKNGQSDSQIQFERFLKDFGSFYFVVRTPSDAHRAVELVRAHILSLTPKIDTPRPNL